jgi:hypothetical protein
MPQLKLSPASLDIAFKSFPESLFVFSALYPSQPDILTAGRISTVGNSISTISRPPVEGGKTHCSVCGKQEIGRGANSVNSP